MDRQEIIANLHELARNFVASSGRAVDSTAAVNEEDAKNFLTHYSFSSIDALEYLLILEEKFGITFEDEDLTEEILSDVNALADYIVSRKESGSPTNA